MKEAKLNIIQDTPQTIPVLKEDAKVVKKVTSKKVRIHKDSTETLHVDNVVLRNEHIDINEVIIDKEVSEIPQISEKDNLIIIPVVKEVEVVIKKLILVKEIHVRKVVNHTEKEVQYAVREEQVRVDREEEQS